MNSYELDGVIDCRRDISFLEMRNINLKYVENPFKDDHSDSIQYQYDVAREKLPKLLGKCIIPTIYDFDIIVNPTFLSFVEKDLYFLGTYEAGVMNMIQKHLRIGDIFIDVGANIGAMTLLARSLVGPAGFVYAFEPHPVVYRDLKENIRINQYDNIMCMQVAIGDSDQNMYLSEREICRGASTLIDRPGNLPNKYLVEVKTLDDLMIKRKRPVNMLKIDAEGYDLRVLNGAEQLILKDRPKIIVECNPQYKVSGEIMHWLCQRQYRLYKLKNRQHYIGDLIEVYRLSDIHDGGKITDLICFPREVKD